MPFSSYLFALLVVFLWAYNGVAIKIGLADIPPLFMTMMRFIVAALCIVPFFWRINRAQLKLVILLAFTFGFMHFALLFIAMSHAEVGISALIVQLGTPFAIIIASVLFKDKLRIKQIIGMLVSLLGVVCLAGSPSIPPFSILVLLLLSALGWAVTNVIVNKNKVKISPIALTGWICLCAIPLVGLASFIFESNQFNSLLSSSWRGWFGILYSAIGSSVIAHSIWSWLLRSSPINLLLPISLLGPVMSVLLGIVFLSEPVNTSKIIGTVLVIGGIFISSINLKGLLIKRHRNKIIDSEHFNRKKG